MENTIDNQDDLREAGVRIEDVKTVIIQNIETQLENFTIAFDNTKHTINLAIKLNSPFHQYLMQHKVLLVTNYN